MPLEGRQLLTDFEDGSSRTAGRGWRPDATLLRVVAGSVFVALLRSFRLYIREEPFDPPVAGAGPSGPGGGSGMDSDGTVGRPKPQPGVMRLDDLRRRFRAAFDSDLFVAEQPGDMASVARTLVYESQEFRVLMEERVSPAHRTSLSDIRRMRRTGEVPATIDWFDLWCFERMRSAAKKLASVRESRFEGEVFMARRGSAARSFQPCYLRIVGNVLVWYSDPARIQGLQMQQQRLKRNFKHAAPGSAERAASQSAFETATQQLKDLMKANYGGQVQVGKNAEVQATIERKVGQLQRLEGELEDKVKESESSAGTQGGGGEGREDLLRRVEKLRLQVSRRREQEEAAERWDIKCVTVQSADLPTPFSF